MTIGIRRGVVLALGLALPAAAHAEQRAEPRLSVGAAATVWVPQSDADDVADVSPGVRPQITYMIIPLLGVTAAFDYVFVNEEGGGDVTYYTIAVGGRITLPRPATLKPYGEVLIGWHVVDAESFAESDLGFRFGGGATYALSRSLALNAGASYSTVSLDTGFGIDVDITAFILDLGVAGRF